MLRWLLICIGIPMLSMGQTSADWWYFGDHAGVHFTSTGPTAVLDGELKSVEGCASISDEFGNLLFYTRGDTIWDASHSVMQNGTGLMANGAGGDGSMNSYIVPRPNDPSEFFVFTVPSFSGGLFYSKVDMELNGGLGGVDPSEKNVALLGSSPEIVTGVRQPNNLDYWVISLKKPGDTAYAFEVTANGVNTTPVLSNTGLSLQSEDQVAYLKASQQNDRLALVIWKSQLTQVNANEIHLFDVDNASGTVSYDLSISPSQQDSLNYGVEFSPSGQYLYVQSNAHPDLRQYDLNAGSANAISASEEFVGFSYLGSGGGALQLGPDGRIYAARNASGFLARVLFPDQPGVLCGYEHDGVNLSGRLSTFGLPQFFPFFIEGEALAQSGCWGDTTFFTSNYLNADSVHWNFGDPLSGTLDTSTQRNPFHMYATPGTYTVTHIAYDGFLSDTTLIELLIKPRQSLDLPDDTVLCDGQSLVFDVDQDGVISYLWQDGSSDSAFVATDSGLVWVSVTGVCDTVSDSTRVIRLLPYQASLGEDTVLCGDSSYTLVSNAPEGYNVSWSGGVTSPHLTVDSSDRYVLMVSGPCDTVRDTIEVRFRPIPQSAVLPDDTLLCLDDPFLLARPRVEGVSYRWSTGGTQEILPVDSTQWVWLESSNECDTVRDSMFVQFNGEIKTELGEDTIVCMGDSVLLAGIDSLASYVWSTGETTPSIYSVPEVNKNYVVTITMGQCEKIESRRVQSADSVCPGLDCSLEYSNIFTPNGDGWNDLFRITTDCNIFSFDLAIYNRWGQLVHYSRNVQQGWDGYVNGEPAAAGTYFFTVQYKDFVVVDADRFSTRGSFTLLR